MVKQDRYQKRFYRQWIKADDLVETRIVIKETDLLILSKDRVDSKFAKEKIKNLRQDIKDYIAKDKRFAVSLKPIPVELNALPIIRLMAEAATLANVGPMAAVAGSIAQLLAEELIKKGYREIIIENGGDIFLAKQERDRSVAVFAGNSKFSGRFNLLIKPSQTPCGVCTSSGTFGHSLSFGNADSVVIVAKHAALADAVATATCNLVKSQDDFNKAVEFVKNISGVSGVLIILDDKFASWGEIEIN
jgi:hypothetical protein